MARRLTARCDRLRRRRRPHRAGLAALEVVLTTAIMIPPLAYLFYYGIQACRNLFSAIGAMVGSPY